MLKFALIAAMSLVLVSGNQESEKKQDSQEDVLASVKCCMMPEQKVKKDVFSEFHDGKVYFCCKRCKGAFEKDKEKFATKANMQLVQTKQFVQKACPIGGGEVNTAHTGKVGDTEVSFCCEKCLAKFNDAADDDARLALVFSEDAFMKGFEKADEKEDKSAEKSDKK